MKRAFDLIAGAAGLVVLAPVLALLALLVLACDGRPVFFRQSRIGYRGVPFVMWKFRTMSNSPTYSPGQASLLTVRGDTRVTRLGAWLRGTKLDELPQLWNVVRGEMSFVGPRPEVSRYVAMYTPEQRCVLDLAPGITDAASLKYRNEGQLLALSPDPERFYCEQILPDKIRLNLEYARRATIFSDWVVILQTIAALVSKTGLCPFPSPD